jgi:hypothetical protein
MEGVIGLGSGILIGMVFGVMLAASAQIRMDSAIAERGFTTIDGQLYVLRPATAEERP